VTLPRNGRYQIVANTYGEGAYGDYEIVMLRARAESASRGDGQVFRGELTAMSETLDDNSRIEVHMIDAQAGENIEVTLASSAFDAVVYVLDTNSELLAQDDDSAGGTNARVSFTVPTSGEYSLVVNSYEPDALGQYTLTVHRGADVAAAPALQGAGDTIQGTLDASNDVMDDGSRYALHLIEAAAGESLDVTMTSSAFDAYLLIVDANGNTIAEDDDSAGGTNARVSVTAPSAGTYTIVANSYGADATGPYTISVVRGEAAAAGAATFGGDLDEGEVVTGELTRANDTMDDGSHYAVHPISASAGETLTITLRSPAFDVYLMVYDDEGGQLADDDDSAGGAQGTDARVTFTAPTSGEYFVIANGYDVDSLGPYTLTVERGPLEDRL